MSRFKKKLFYILSQKYASHSSFRIYSLTYRFSSLFDCFLKTKQARQAKLSATWRTFKIVRVRTMIVSLMNFLRLHSSMKIPLVFSYYSVRMMLAALTSLLMMIFLGPWFIRLLGSIKGDSAVRTEDCPAVICEQHNKKRHTPTMGGALILFSMVTSMFLWMDLTHVFTLILLLATLIFGVLGARDDYLKLKYSSNKGISARKKLFCQGVVSAGLALYLFRIPR